MIFEKQGSVFLEIHLQPRASRDKIVGEHDGRLKVQITAPPVDNQANKQLVAFLAKKLGVAKSAVEIVKGETSRQKTIKIDGLAIDQVKNKLSKFL